MSEINKTSKSKKSAKLALRLIVGLLVLLMLAAIVYLFLQNRDLKSKQESNQSSSVKLANKYSEKVGKLIDLPSGETPTVAKITDAKKINKQQFYKDAKNGDIILIYPNAKKLVLYRESENKVINEGPLVTTAPTTSKPKK